QARQLRDDGFVVIPDAQIPSSTIEKVASSSKLELSDLLQLVAHAGVDPVEQLYNFNEVCHRFKYRWDFRVQPESRAWEELMTQAIDTVSPIIRELHRLSVHPDEGGHRMTRLITPKSPTAIMSGAILSKPGALSQRFHADASPTHLRMASLFPSHRLFNIFVPLVDIEANGDGTQFLPGTHHSRRAKHRFKQAVERAGRLEDDATTMATAVAPACPAGGVMLFDYRVLHRGLANNSTRDRPIAYSVCSTGWAWDNCNFPDTKIRNVVEYLPKDQDELKLTRDVISKSCPYWYDIL
ncbi:MAG: hypothetical protein SGPRY_014069, partial [Prymnesium sp.]